MEVTVTVTDPTTPAAEPAPEVMVPDFPDLDDVALAALRDRVEGEVRRRRTLVDAARQVERAAETWRAAQGLTDGTAWVQPTGAHDAVPPGESRVFEGALWRNTSGTYLTHSPAEFPAGWTLAAEVTDPVVLDPAQYPAWTVGTTYKAGDVVTYGGAVFRCVQGHTAQPGWEPPNVAALWVRV